jgi:hypothetical protein
VLLDTVFMSSWPHISARLQNISWRSSPTNVACRWQVEGGLVGGSDTLCFVVAQQYATLISYAQSAFGLVLTRIFHDENRSSD